MTKRSKKPLSILLALVMVMSLFAVLPGVTAEADGTKTIQVGVINYVMNETDETNWKVHYWDESGAHDVALTETGESIIMDVGYWSTAQKFTMFNAEIPTTATGFNVKYQNANMENPRWLNDSNHLDGNVSSHNAALVFNYDGDKTLYYNFQPLAGHSITLGSDIDMNFFFDPSVVAAGDDVKFGYIPAKNTESGTTDAMKKTFTLSNDKTKTVNIDGSDVNCYVATCNVSAAEMASDVTAALTKDGVTYISTKSVQSYANDLLVNNNNANEVALVKAMLDYGAKAHAKFNINTVAAPSAGEYNAEAVSSTDIKTAIVGRNSENNKAKTLFSGYVNGETNYSDAQYAGTTLKCEDKTTLSHYYSFTATNREAAVAFANHVGGLVVANWAVEAVKEQGENDVYVETERVDDTDYYTTYVRFYKSDIGADDLHKVQTLTFNKKSFDFAALDYAGGVVKANEKGSTEFATADVNLAKAMYLYNRAAVVYTAA